MATSKTSRVTKSSRRSSPSGTVWTAIASLSGLAGAAIALLGVSVANHWWPFKEPVSLAISPPVNGSVPRCTTITGSMSLPSGSTVWLAQQGAGQPNYYNLTKATGSSSGWTATMTIGTAADTGKPFTIYAFAANQQATSVLNSIVAGGSSKPFYYLSSLPSQITAKPINVVRNETDTTAC
jgi:hypothetical protein